MKNNTLAKWIDKLYPEEKQKLSEAFDLQHAERSVAEVYPPEENIFEALVAFQPDQTKVVIIGQDPYHGPKQAMGMSFSVNDGIALPPSLQNIYKEIQNELGGEIPATGNLRPWAEQGVLLLNASLTVEANKANSHQQIWNTTTDAFLRICLQQEQPIVFMLWGSFAQKMLDRVTEENGITDPPRKLILTSTHPSPYSALTPSSTAPAFMGCGHFKKANMFLESFGVQPVKWF